jgi:branched-chain amino acid transport system substrate-binding protein
MKTGADAGRLGLLLLVLTIGLTGCGAGIGPGSASDDGPLRIGLLLELSGPAASFGVPERDGAQLLADKINEEGGVRGRRIELSVYDTAGNTTRCARGASELIRRKQVIAIIGGTTGSCTLAAAPVAERNKIPMLAPNGTIQVTDPANSFYPWIFRSQVSDLETTKAMFDGATSTHSNIGLFFQQDAYGKDTADYVRNVLAQPPVAITGEASAPLTAPDVASQATQLRNAAPDVVLLQLSSAKLGAAFTHAAHQVGLEAEQWVGNGIGTRAFVDAAGASADGLHLMAVANPYNPGARLAQLAALFAERGKRLEGFGEALGATALVAIAEAIKQSPAIVGGQQIRDALEQVCIDAPYTEGQLCFGPQDHDALDAAAIVEVVVRNGKFVTVDER